MDLTPTPAYQPRVRGTPRPAHPRRSCLSATKSACVRVRGSAPDAVDESPDSRHTVPMFGPLFEGCREQRHTARVSTLERDPAQPSTETPSVPAWMLPRCSTVCGATTTDHSRETSASPCRSFSLWEGRAATPGTVRHAFRVAVCGSVVQGLHTPPALTAQQRASDACPPRLFFPQRPRLFCARVTRRAPQGGGCFHRGQSRALLAGHASGLELAPASSPIGRWPSRS